MANKPGKPGVLSARWSKKAEYGYNHGRRGDIEYNWGDGCSRADGALLHDTFSHAKNCLDSTFVDEITARGYDITTLRFTIKKSPLSRDDPRDDTKG
jgi:hypothetical protein